MNKNNLTKCTDENNVISLRLSNGVSISYYKFSKIFTVSSSSSSLVVRFHRDSVSYKDDGFYFEDISSEDFFENFSLYIDVQKEDVHLAYNFLREVRNN